MPRTPLEPDLLHAPDDATADGARLDRVVALAAESLRPFVREALLRDTAVTGARAWTEPAAAALASLLGVPLDDAVRDPAMEQLASALRDGIPPPDDAEIDEHARRAAKVLVPSWVELLRRSLGASAQLELDAQLLPAPSVADPSLVQHWFDALEPFALRLDEVTEAMSALAPKLRELGDEVELPAGLVLARTDDAAVVRRGAHARDRARGAGILESGEQRRHGPGESAPEATGDAQTAARPPRRR